MSRPRGGFFILSNGKQRRESPVIGLPGKYPEETPVFAARARACRRLRETQLITIQKIP